MSGAEQLAVVRPMGPGRRPMSRRTMQGLGDIVMTLAVGFAILLPIYGGLEYVGPLPATFLVLGASAAIAAHPWLVRGTTGRRWRANLGARAIDGAALPWLAAAALLFQCYNWISPALRAQITAAVQPPPPAYAHAGAPLGWLIGPLTVALLMPLAEEYMFRGYMLHRLGRTLGRPIALAVTSIVYGLLHGSLRLAPAFILAGVVFGCAALAFRSIWAPILLHMLANSCGQIPATARLPHILEPVARGYWPSLLTAVFVCGALLLLYRGYRARLAAGRRRREAQVRFFRAIADAHQPA